MRHINFDTHLKKNIYESYDLYFQKVGLHALYCGDNEPDLEREIRKKYNSYKQQDKKKHKYNPELHITYDELIQKLYDCDLRCYYCKIDLCILYTHKKTPSQWSLERFNNDIGHYSSNTCIACLRCNLQRRNENHIHFKFSKQLTLIRLESI